MYKISVHLCFYMAICVYVSLCRYQLYAKSVYICNYCSQMYTKFESMHFHVHLNYLLINL